MGCFRMAEKYRSKVTLVTLPAGSLKLVTTNPICGNNSPRCHSILAATRRGLRVQF